MQNLIPSHMFANMTEEMQPKKMAVSGTYALVGTTVLILAEKVL